MKKLMLAFVLLLGVVVSVKAQSIYGDKVKTDVKMKYLRYLFFWQKKDGASISLERRTGNT